MTPEKYLEAARVKRGFNQPMNMRELAAAYGMAYGKIRSLALSEDFPMAHGVVFPKDFERWLAKARRPRAGADPRQNAADTSHALGSRNGSPGASPRSVGSRLSLNLSPSLRGGSETYA